MIRSSPVSILTLRRQRDRSRESKHFLFDLMTRGPQGKSLHHVLVGLVLALLVATSGCDHGQPASDSDAGRDETEPGDSGGSQEVPAAVTEFHYDQRFRSSLLGIETSMYGVGFAAEGPGPYPLVLIQHGNHGNCRIGGEDVVRSSTFHECPDTGATTVPNPEGLSYLAHDIASRGFIVVSIGANMLRAEGRDALFVEHLRHLANHPSSIEDFTRRIDFSKVFIVGHSVSAEFARLAPATLMQHPVVGASIAGIVAIEPTSELPDVSMPTSYLVVTGSCDGDVPLYGMREVDRQIAMLGESDVTGVFVQGLDHNGQNTEWAAPDREAERICTAAERVDRAVGRTWTSRIVSDWIDARASGANLPAYLQNTGAQRPAALESADLRITHFPARSRRLSGFPTQEGGDIALSSDELVGEPCAPCEFMKTAAHALAPARRIVVPIGGGRLELRGGFGSGSELLARIATCTQELTSPFQPIPNFVVRIVGSAGETSIQADELAGMPRPILFLAQPPILHVLHLPIATLGTIESVTLEFSEAGTFWLGEFAVAP